MKTHNLYTSKFILLCSFVMLLCSKKNAIAQTSSTPVALHYCSATRSSANSSGSFNHTTDSFETGNMIITTSGPIAYTVSPADLSMGTNSTQNWIGSIYIDTTNASFPAQGDSTTATLTGNYTITYSSPASPLCPPANPGGHQSPGGTWSCKGSIAKPCFAGHTSPQNHTLVTETGTVTKSFIVFHDCNCNCAPQQGNGGVGGMINSGSGSGSNTVGSNPRMSPMVNDDDHSCKGVTAESLKMSSGDYQIIITDPAGPSSKSPTVVPTGGNFSSCFTLGTTVTDLGGGKYSVTLTRLPGTASSKCCSFLYIIVTLPSGVTCHPDKINL